MRRASPRATSATLTPPPKRASAATTPRNLKLVPDDMLMFDTNNSATKVLGKTPRFDGGTRSFTVTLKPGTYTYYC